MADSDMVRVGIVDDDPYVRSSLSDLLRRQPDLVIEFLAADGAQAIAETRRTTPNVVLMDIRMPGMDGIAATTRIRSEHPALKVLLTTSLDFAGDLPAAIGAGASGMILKTSPLKVLADQIRAVHHGAAVWTAEPFRRWTSQQHPAVMASTNTEVLTGPPHGS
ncbi:MAG: response regulator transcription factor [Nigerium sp.]|nr:response regulator transcription factor [Nigerium sp.]